MKTRTLLVCLMLATGGCAKAPPVPTDNFYRLPPPQAGQPLGAPWSGGILLVRQLRADGLHSDRALLYSDDAQGLLLKRYAYHLWVDPPPKLVQQQLAAYLRAIGAARMVMTVADAAPALIVSGRITRFERQEEKTGVVVHVGLELRLEDDHGRPLLQNDYHADLPAADAGIMATVNTIDKGLNRIYAEFAGDAAKVLSQRSGVR